MTSFPRDMQFPLQGNRFVSTVACRVCKKYDRMYHTPDSGGPPTGESSYCRTCLRGYQRGRFTMRTPSGKTTRVNASMVDIRKAQKWVVLRTPRNFVLPTLKKMTPELKELASRLFPKAIQVGKGQKQTTRPPMPSGLPR